MRRWMAGGIVKAWLRPSLWASGFGANGAARLAEALGQAAENRAENPVPETGRNARSAGHRMRKSTAQFAAIRARNRGIRKCARVPRASEAHFIWVSCKSPAAAPDIIRAEQGGFPPCTEEVLEALGRRAAVMGRSRIGSLGRFCGNPAVTRTGQYNRYGIICQPEVLHLFSRRWRLACPLRRLSQPNSHAEMRRRGGGQGRAQRSNFRDSQGRGSQDLPFGGAAHSGPPRLLISACHSSGAACLRRSRVDLPRPARACSRRSRGSTA